ncbi:DUF6146 family protein [Moheibacter sp.]|uniref:DUF6146 family protein n=1 Tax=Moheibacter sp. TaxID=1965316 RepID=UPI003C718423
MKKLIFLLVVPMVSFAQNDSLRLDEKLQGKNGNEVKSPDLPKPLYFINGKQTNEAVVNELDPNTIESINVLKGEKAIEKYGEQGKNGLIEIKLKKREVSMSIKTVGCNQSFIPENALFVIDGEYVEKNKFEALNATDIFSVDILKNTGITHISRDVVIIKTKKYQEELGSQEEYDLAVLDLGYESFMAMQPSASSYSLNYLENKNNHYVSVWNSRVISGNKDIYEMPIDYDSRTYYGLEFEYKLFMFFKFMENKHKISFI